MASARSTSRGSRVTRPALSSGNERAPGVTAWGSVRSLPPEYDDYTLVVRRGVEQDPVHPVAVHVVIRGVASGADGL